MSNDDDQDTNIEKPSDNPNKSKFASYDDAKAYAQKSGVKTQEEWSEHVSQGHSNNDKE